MKPTIRTNILRLFLVLIILFILVPENRAQQSIGGAGLNIFAKVDSVGTDYVRVQSNPGFLPLDTILIIQMKGVRFFDTPDLTFGDGQNYEGRYGYYEFLIVEQVTGTGPYRLKFRNNLLDHTWFKPESSVQIIKIPSFGDATVTSELTTQPWDSASGTGGVLSFIVGRTLTLEANINVSGKGFRGGLADIVAGAPVTDGPFGAGQMSYTLANNVAGYKGEGTGSHIMSGGVLNFKDHARGFGKISIAGGGGNGQFGGGGGGGSYGQGRPGGDDYVPNLTGGVPGEAIETAGGITWSPIIMGGGGGASGYTSGAISHGGNGGGIIIILADSLIGGGYSIYASGDSVQIMPDPNVGGAGGGGGAGSIALSTRSYDNITELNLRAEGGRGGHSQTPYGNGGGGGGGLVFTNTDVAPNPNVITSLIGGNTGGRNVSGVSAGTIPRGFPGLVWSDLKMRLNGFLFNTIQSSVSKNDYDSICANQVPYKIIGTDPIGGTPGYNFLWQRSYDGSAWADYPSTTNTRDLIPTIVETDTVWFRRVVTDSGGPALSDTSKAIKFLVQPLISGNDIGFIDGIDTVVIDTICFGQAINTIVPIETLGGGNFNSPYADSAFWWAASTVNSNLPTWANAPGEYSERDYDTTRLETTMYYYRIVVSGRCIDTSNVARVEVLPLIGSNILSPSSTDTVACGGSALADIIGPGQGTGLTGGDGTFRYVWEKDTGPGYAPFGVTSKDYISDEASFARDNTEYYRRIVKSGKDDRCRDTSNIVSLLMYTALSNNSISSIPNPLICELENPVSIDGSVPVSGDPANRIYKWEYSTDNVLFDSIPTNANGLRDYDFPNGLSQTTWFRRVVSSSSCVSISDTGQIVVQPDITNNIIFSVDGSADTALCSGGDPNMFHGTTSTTPVTPLAGGVGAPFTYEWISSTGGQYATAPGTSSGNNYDPGSLTQTNMYRRIVSSGVCQDTSTIEITVTIYPVISSNFITPGDNNCIGDDGNLVEGSLPLGGKPGEPHRYEWREGLSSQSLTTVAGITSQDILPGPINEYKYFQRIVTSGDEDNCIDTSDVVVVMFDSLPDIAVAGPDQDLVAYQENTVLSATPIIIGTGTWTLNQKDSEKVPVIEDPNNPMSEVSNIGGGVSVFRWTVSNGACPSTFDDLNVSVLELLIPSGISPNGDNINDIFDIPGIEYSKNDLIITDMSGVVVYKMQNYDGEWKAEDMYGKPLPDGTYYYFLNITYPLLRQDKGYLIIKRDF